MIYKILFLVNALIISDLFLSCGDNKPEVKKGENSERIISFSGFTWIVDDSGSSRINPGQNYFSGSEENVWVDSRGNLHLKITNRNGIWYCAKVTLKESYAFNKYVFYVSSRVDKFDKNVVSGLFTYLDDSNEIDIEFSKWGIDGEMDSQFAVQPAHHDGNIYRYSMNLKGRYSTHIIDWKKDKIDFASYHGHSSTRPHSGRIISEWSYTGKFIPVEGEEKIMINLWLFKGNPPSDKKEAELIIKAFEIY